jgi:hypothetical protein
MQRICNLGENKSVRSKTSKLFIRRPLSHLNVTIVHDVRIRFNGSAMASVGNTFQSRNLNRLANFARLHNLFPRMELP